MTSRCLNWSLLAACAASPFSVAALPRETVVLDSDWRFHRHDPTPVGTDLSREALRPWLLPQTNEFSNFLPVPHTRPEGTEPGASLPAIRPDYDDSGWRTLDLPHDWGIEGPFIQSLPGNTGKLPWQGVGWYRRKITLPATDAGRRLVLEFDGAMAHSAIWVNGRFAGGWPYGYSSFRLDITRLVTPGSENTIAVRLDNPPDSSRWYPGSGLYRQVRLVKTDPVYIEPWSVFITTPQVSPERAIIDVGAEVENTTAQPVRISIAAQVHRIHPDGSLSPEPLVSAEPQEIQIKPGALRRSSFSLPLASPALWDLDTPELHAAVITVRRDGAVIDRQVVSFGIRSLSVDPTRGLLLNGRVVRINGVCQHHDLGALGSAVHPAALARQLRILREMGVNSIRTSHNPPAPELLELCDRMGLLVQVEAFDAWALSKIPNDYGPDFAAWHEADLRAMVRRDRNHPSVVMWSVGNEILEQGSPNGWRLCARLAGILREEDRTRPTTGGFNWEGSPYLGFAEPVDIFGYNYKPHQYPRFRERHPGIALIGSETSSTVSSRGEYFFPVVEDRDKGQADFQMSSYDLYAPPWATTPDTEFTAQDATPSVLGEYVWTGFDYLGEPTPYNDDVTNILNYTEPAAREQAHSELVELGRITVPSRSSYFGIVDLAGFPKDRYYLYQSRWRPELPMAHLLPHWTWPGREGQVTPVHLYTSGDEAELFLNGKSLGKRRRGPGVHRLRWDEVVYEPGELRAVAYKDGKPWAESTRRTAGPAAALALSAEAPTLRADGHDLAFLTLRVLDAAGLPVPRAALPVLFTIEGPGVILATDNGNAIDHTTFSSPERRTYNGLALAIVRATRSATGKITVKAEAEGVAGAKLVLALE